MNQEYPQVYELGLGSLVGDFFQNVKDTVTGVAKAVAPIAPYILPFTGIPLPYQYALGAGINLAAGKKPVQIAKDLALQVGIGGLRGAMMRPEGATFGQGFKQGAFGITPDIKVQQGSGQVSGISNVYDKLKDSRLNPFSDVSQYKTNPKFAPEMKQYSEAIDKMFPLVNSEGQPLDPTLLSENLLQRGIYEKQLGIVPEKIERGFLGQYGPAAAAGLTALTLPSLLSKPEEETEEESYAWTPNELYYTDPSRYQLKDITGPEGYDPGIYLAAKGGEITGFAAGSGQMIEHPDGRTMEHPKRIGEIAGKGTGTSDDIPAMLSDGEFVMTAQAVRNAGGGSRKEGAKRMYQMMKNLENGGRLSQQSMGMA